jgi:nitronate monooxygenase
MLLPGLKIGDLYVEKPIIQGGMGVGISLAGLAGAVAHEGGIGVISSVGIGFLKGERNKKGFRANAHYLKEEIIQAKARNKKGAVGVNIMVAISDFDELVKASVEAEADIIFAGAGLPLHLPALVKEVTNQPKTQLGVIVSSARAADIICKNWLKKHDCLPDIVVVEGPKAGGHLGFSLEQINDSAYALENLLPQVVETVSHYENQYSKEIPVIAAGGVYSGEDIFRFMDLGADGVQMGTRFVATDECDADRKFKEKFLQCTEKDITIIKSPVGLPGRVINSTFVEEERAGIRKPFSCPWKCLKTCNFKNAPYCIANALINAQKGLMDDGFAFAGANAYLVNKIVSVKELFRELTEEFDQAVFQHFQQEPLKIEIV